MDKCSDRCGNAGSRSVRWLLGTAIALGMAAPLPALAADAKAAAAAKTNSQAATAAVQAATAALTKELAAHDQNPGTPLRDKSNYFTENPSADLTPEVIVQALVSKFRPDAMGDSYIKWQLLSAVPGKFDEKLSPTAADALMKAARPLPRPGVTADDRRKLDPYLKSIRNEEDAAKINKQLDELVAKWDEKNKPILAYRDDLYAKLTPGPATLLARLQDGAQRGEAGIDSNIMMKGVVEDIAQWSSHDVAPRDCLTMADQVQKILLDKMGGNKAKGGGTGGGKSMRGGGGYGSGGAYGGGGGRYPGGGGGGAAAAAIPAKYYEIVEYDAQKKIWMWHEKAPRFSKTEEISDLVTTLEDAAKGKANAGMMKK